MSVYLDTSVVMSFFLTDVHATTVRAWAATSPDVVLSDWTATEFTSAMSHYLRQGRLTEHERDRTERTFDRWASQHHVLDVARERFGEARILMRVHRRLRAPDALHLAIALESGLSMATLDQDMRDAAIAEGLSVVDL